MSIYAATEPFLVGLIGLACAWHLLRPRLRKLRGTKTCTNVTDNTTCTSACGGCGNGQKAAPHKAFTRKEEALPLQRTPRL